MEDSIRGSARERCLIGDVGTNCIAKFSARPGALHGCRRVSSAACLGGGAGDPVSCHPHGHALSSSRPAVLLAGPHRVSSFAIRGAVANVGAASSGDPGHSHPVADGGTAVTGTWQSAGATIRRAKLERICCQVGGALRALSSGRIGFRGCDLDTQVRDLCAHRTGILVPDRGPVSVRRHAVDLSSLHSGRGSRHPR